MEFVTNEKLTIVGAAGMIGSNMAQTAIMMGLTPNICLYDPYAPGLVNPEKPDVPLNKNDAFQKVQKRRVQEKR